MLKFGFLKDLEKLISLLFGVLWTNGLLRVLFRLPFRLSFLVLPVLLVVDNGIIFFSTLDSMVLVFLSPPENFIDLFVYLKSRSNLGLLLDCDTGSSSLHRLFMMLVLLSRVRFNLFPILGN